jgi:RNA polymerase sigma-70 factor (ECF subfamily)
LPAHAADAGDLMGNACISGKSTKWDTVIWRALTRLPGCEILRSARNSCIERIVIGRVATDKTMRVEPFPIRAPDSRAKLADVMGPRGRVRNGVAGLLARSRASPPVFGDFYEQMGRPVFRFFATRTEDPQRAVDLTAETFAQAFAHRREFRGASDEQAAAWLWKIAHNELKQHWRSRSSELATVERLRLEHPGLSEEELVEGERSIAAEELREQIQRALELLPNDQREVIRLRFIDELSYDEIAQKLGVSNDLVRTRTSRALRTLRSSAHLHEAIRRLQA